MVVVQSFALILTLFFLEPHPDRHLHQQKAKGKTIDSYKLQIKPYNNYSYICR